MVRVFYSILLAFVLLNPVHGQPTTPSGIEQLKQFVKTVRSAQGEFVQQQMRSPKANEPQDKPKMIRQTSGQSVFQRPAVLSGIPKSRMSKNSSWMASNF